MAKRQVSDEGNDFEVLPRHQDGDFVSLNSATSAVGDPYEQRKDILESKVALEKLKGQLNFGNDEMINEIHGKLKSREALDARISDEIVVLDDISNNAEWNGVKEVTTQAKDLVSKVKELAKDKKTTVKRAQDVLDICLPSFILACQLSEEDIKLSSEYSELQDLYQEVKAEVLRCQQEFQMEEREEKVKEGHALLQRSISAASSECERIDGLLVKEKDSANFEKFKQDENHVDLMIKAEIHELGGWLKNCQSDSYKIESVIEDQNQLFTDATTKFNGHVREIDVSLEINAGRQADLMKQLDELKKEEKKLKNERVFQVKVQQKAEDLNVKLLAELKSLQKKISDIKEHASTAEEIMQTIKECSNLLLTKSFEIQKAREEKLSQLMIEALMRERNVMSTAVVEFKLREKMADENIQEYVGQIELMSKDIARAASKGQGLTVAKRRQELKEYEEEVEKEKENLTDCKSKSDQVITRLKKVDEKLEKLGVSSQSIESLIAQRLSEMQEGSSGPMSFVSM